jgi:hypothetical protein
LLVEVADSSLQKDRAKVEIYLSAGVEGYWILNLEEKHLECYLNGAPDSLRIYSWKETVRTTIGDKTIELALGELF